MSERCGIRVAVAALTAAVYAAAPAHGQCPANQFTCYQCPVGNGPGCLEGPCCLLICQQDPFCCNTSWDCTCAQAATALCGNCGGIDAGSCWAPNGSSGCNVYSCCDIVCAADFFCCDNEWDEQCVLTARQFCAVPPCPWDCDGTADGNANVLDLLTLIGQFDPGAPGTCDGGESCDFDGDGCVDVVDLLKLLGAYTPGPMGIGCVH